MCVTCQRTYRTLIHCTWVRCPADSRGCQLRESPRTRSTVTSESVRNGRKCCSRPASQKGPTSRVTLSAERPTKNCKLKVCQTWAREKGDCLLLLRFPASPQEPCFQERAQKEMVVSRYLDDVSAGYIQAGEKSFQIWTENMVLNFMVSPHRYPTSICFLPKFCALTFKCKCCSAKTPFLSMD